MGVTPNLVARKGWPSASSGAPRTGAGVAVPAAATGDLRHGCFPQPVALGAGFTHVPLDVTTLEVTSDTVALFDWLLSALVLHSGLLDFITLEDFVSTPRMRQAQRRFGRLFGDFLS